MAFLREKSNSSAGTGARPADPSDKFSANRHAGISQGKLRRIMLDAGHGGKDFGAINKRMDLAEKDVNLQITIIVKELLEAAGIEVLLTRSKDDTLSLTQRSTLANEQLPDVFVSIHANAAEDRTAQGFEVYYDSQQWSPQDKAAVATRRSDIDVRRIGGAYAVDETTEELLYRMVFDENLRQSKLLAQAVLHNFARTIRDKNRGVKRKNLHVTRETFVPSVLVEVGFVTHDATASQLKKADHCRVLAKAIVQGILDFRKVYDNSQGFIN